MRLCLQLRGKAFEIGVVLALQSTDTSPVGRGFLLNRSERQLTKDLLRAIVFLRGDKGLGDLVQDIRL